MKTNHRRPDSYGVVTTLVIVLSVWLVQANGFLQNTDDRLSDLVNAFSARSFNRSKVLLVYAPEAILQSDDKRLVELVHAISEFEPAKIGIAHSLPESQLLRLSSLHCASDIVVGYTKKTAKGDYASRVSTSPGTIQSGFLDLHLDGQPIYRNHVGNSGTSLNPVWSFEAAIANQIARSSDLIPEGILKLRFESGANGMPHVLAKDFAGNRVIEEMVRDRIVLIGRIESEDVGFVTPTTNGKERMSTLELRGNFLQSLRNGNHITSLSSLQILLVISLLAFAVIQWARNVLNGWVRRTCLGVSVLVCMTAWMALSVWSIQLPVSAMLLTTLVSFAAVLYSRYRALKELVENWRLLRHTSDRLTETTPKEDAWSALAASVNQIFFPQRMALLELPQGATHLNIVSLHDCCGEEIEEKRRDINRDPFRDAITAGEPKRCGERPFFVRDADNESVQFLVPLIMVSDVIGFMVVEMDQDVMDQVVIDQRGDFSETLSHYASEMAIFLANSRHSGAIEDPAKNLIQRTRMLPEQLMSREILNEEFEHRRAEKMLSETLECSETSLAVFDIFGQLVKTNTKMLSRLQRKNLSDDEVNCVGVLAAMTNYELSECRKVFQRCIVEERTERIVLPSDSEDGSTSVLFVKPLSQGELNTPGGIETRFAVIEILSGGVFEQINYWQQEFLSSHNQRTQQQIDQLERIAGMLSVSDEVVPSSVDSFNELANEVLQTALDAKEAIAVNLARSPQECFMLSSVPLLDSALRQSSLVRDAQGIKLSRTGADQVSEVMGNPFCLERTFAAVIDCMILECDDQTKLIIDLQETDGQVTYQFSTRPETSLLEGQDFPGLVAKKADGSSHNASQDMLLSKTQLSCLSDSQRSLQHWGGKLDIECDGCFRIAISVTLATTTHKNLLTATSNTINTVVDSNALGDDYV